MNESTKTKKALRGSLLALFLCIVLLIGTTFAWFTDTASTGVNKIQAGNLDVELEYSTDMVEWKPATSSTKLFDDKTLWEPGVTEVVYLRVKNNGNLALKYTMGLSSNVGFADGKNVAGERYNVGDYLKMGTAEVTKAFDTREAAQAAVSGNADAIKKLKPFVEGMPIVESGKITDPIALVIYMPTDVGNEANPIKKTTSTGTSDSSLGASYVYRLGVEVNATQAAVENDSFDNTYDEKAATVFKAENASSGVHEITTNMQASGRYGVVQAERSAQFTINADVYAKYKDGAAMAVKAGGTSKIIINGGNFRQVSVPDNDKVCDLIYATDSAQIEINDGTFKAVTPANTLNVFDSDRGKAMITVNGGKFYKFNPETDNPDEVVLGTGHTVVQEGDWYVVK